MKITPSVKFSIIIGSLLLPLLVAIQFAGAAGPGTQMLRASATTTLVGGSSCTATSNAQVHVTVYVTNNAKWPTVDTGTSLLTSTVGGSRDVITNTFVINSYTISETLKNRPVYTNTWFISLTETVPPTGPYSIGNTWTVDWAYTSNMRPDRWNPIVLPGEATAITYYGIECQGSTPGPYTDAVTIAGTFNGQPVSLTTSYSYTVPAG